MTISNNMRKRITTSEAAKQAGFTPYSPYDTADANAKYSKQGREETEKLAAVGLWNKILYAPDATARNAAIQAVVESPAAKANGVTDIDFESGMLFIHYPTKKKNSLLTVRLAPDHVEIFE